MEDAQESWMEIKVAEEEVFLINILVTKEGDMKDASSLLREEEE
jgi:hypothetical protein